ncbi:uncharacterized protein M421DRAFT_258957 [Didymella exigua CBS 183.55]|uniref:Uncharacterized protein n=1 Tax=Didymella exigua CBS 183.55 TaxID=1150837 RepID=A0A6A5RI86_9PLEO|nr:uncharacterized protein M421DRAFT_258957 [Didymella exigua CBS 183.55]KAF1925307.1 hypothetical protein M421DRAFT_258957 [Didymella exigua CBS 183.55]
MWALLQRQRLQNENIADKLATFNEKNSLFLFKLPAEIRTMIYAYALSDIVIRIKPTNTDPDWCIERKSTRKALFLPRVCRQIHHETASLVFSLATFRMPVYALAPFVGSIGIPRANNIRSVSLELHKGIKSNRGYSRADSGYSRDEIDQKELLAVSGNLKVQGKLNCVEFIHNAHIENVLLLYSSPAVKLFSITHKTLQDPRIGRKFAVDINLEEMKGRDRNQWVEEIGPRQ